MNTKKAKTATLPAIRVDGAIRENLEKLAEKDNRELSDYLRLHLTKLAQTLQEK